MSTANIVIPEFSELLSDYYHANDLPREAVTMCSNWVNGNELSISTFGQMLRKMGGKLITLIIKEQRIKHREILDKFIFLMIVEFRTKDLATKNAIEVRVLRIVPTRGLITVITMNISMSEIGTCPKVDTLRHLQITRW